MRLTHVGRSALWGRVEEVVNPSPARIFPRCLHYTKCGGCQFRHMNYAEELEAKRIRVEDALRRLGGAEIHVSGRILGRAGDRYRNKAQFPAAKAPRIGFYRPRSHDVIDVDDCLLQGEAAARLRGAVKEWMAEYSIPAYNERTFTAWQARAGMCAPTGPAAACAACWSMAGASPGRSSWCAPCAGPSPTWPESCWG